MYMYLGTKSSIEYGTKSSPGCWFVSFHYQIIQLVLLYLHINQISKNLVWYEES